MSARIEPRPNDRLGRVVMVAALAGLTGVAITVVAAVTLLLSASHRVESAPGPVRAAGARV